MADLTKKDIRVTIDSEEKQQRAIEILNKHGEKIWDDDDAMKFDKYYCSLRFYCDLWSIISVDDALTEITLDQLDELLAKQEK